MLLIGCSHLGIIVKERPSHQTLSSGPRYLVFLTKRFFHKIKKSLSAFNSNVTFRFTYLAFYRGDPRQ